MVPNDFWGPLRVIYLSGFKWFINFIDDCTHDTWIYLLKDKPDPTTTFKHFHKMIENQFHAKILSVEI